VLTKICAAGIASRAHCHSISQACSTTWRQPIMSDIPQDALTDRLLHVMADYLDVPVETLTPETTIASLHIDSLDFIEMVFLIEEQVGVSLDGALEDLRQKLVCVGDVITFAREQAQLAATQASPSTGPA
jgi:acyl carrier protein